MTGETPEIIGTTVGRLKRAVFYFASALLLFWAGQAFSSDFSAAIADVSGEVVVMVKSSGETVPAVKGMRLYPGDSVKTKAGSEAEIFYEDGNISRIGEKSWIGIKQMSVEPDKSRQTVLDLTFGRIKNVVGKLTSSNSKFEVHSKTAVTTSTGVSKWVMGLSGSLEKPMTEVFVLPDRNKSQQKGAVTVKAEGLPNPPIKIEPGQSTTIQPGKPPEPPRQIQPKQLAVLEKNEPIKTRPLEQFRQLKGFEKAVNSQPPEPREPREPRESGVPAGPTGTAGPTGRDKPLLGSNENYVMFESRPQGCEITVDGIYFGNTPLDFPLKNGQHTVRIYRPGYYIWEKKVLTFAGFRLSAEMDEVKK